MVKSKVRLILLLILSILGAVFFAYFRRHGWFQTKAQILSACTGHAPGNFHYHANFEIRQDEKRIDIPANIGVIGDCIHPVHTHDMSGLIHVDYPKDIPFTLGDLFDTIGIIFNDEQIGLVKKHDGYTVLVLVDDRPRKNNYRGIILKDKETIKISVTSPKNLSAH